MNNQSYRLKMNTTSKHILLALALIVSFTVSVKTQQPFQDAKGEGSLFIDGGGFAQINIADPSIRLGFLRNLSDSKWIYGFGLNGKVSGMQAALIGKNNLSPDAQGNFTIGYKFTKQDTLEKVELTKEFLKEFEDILRKQDKLKEGEILPAPQTAVNLSQYMGELETSILRGRNLGDIYSLGVVKKFSPKYKQLTFQGGYAYKQYKLYDPASAFKDQYYKKSFHSPIAELGYFQKIDGRKLFGVSAGVKRTNNSDDLTEVEVRDFTTSVNNSTTREVTRVRKALSGDFTQSTEVFINSDYTFFPKELNSRIGINLFTRSKLTGVNQGFRPGVGIFLTKEKSPTSVIGGVSVSVDTNGKTNIALIAGYNF